MRVFGALVVAAALGVLAATAAADPIPIPPVPTVTMPTVTVTVPSLPAPPPAPAPTPSPPPITTTATAPAATTAPTPSPAAPAAPKAETASPVQAATPSAPAVPQVGGSSSRATPSYASPPQVKTIGTRRHRSTTFTFVLRHAGPVVLTVTQVSPVCAEIGRLRLAGHAGPNRYRFAGVVHGRRLVPGTYLIAIRTRAGTVLRRVMLVVGEGSAPADVCRSVTSAVTAVAGSAGHLAQQHLSTPQPAAAGLAPAAGPPLPSGVLGSSVAKTARAIQPFLVAALALAIILLGSASLPREAVPGPRAYYVLARHRLELAALGTGVLIAIALTFLLD
jgi:hypothetical protein